MYICVCAYVEPLFREVTPITSLTLCDNENHIKTYADNYIVMLNMITICI